MGVGGAVGLRCDFLVLSCWPPIVLLLWLGWGLGGSWVSWGLGCGGLGFRWVVAGGMLWVWVDVGPGSGPGPFGLVAGGCGTRVGFGVVPFCPFWPLPIGSALMGQ